MYFSKTSFLRCILAIKITSFLTAGNYYYRLLSASCQEILRKNLPIGNIYLLTVGNKFYKIMLGGREMTSNIGDFIKKLRNKNNMTLTYLENKSGVSNSHISRIERGLREPSPDTLKKLSGPLGVSYKKLLKVAGYLDNEEQDKKIENALSNDPELKEIWEQISKRDSLKLLFKQSKDMTDEDIKQMIRIMNAINENERKNN
jgi:transcriptional regulator with XRE-family HTH domain